MIVYISIFTSLIVFFSFILKFQLLIVGINKSLIEINDGINYKLNLCKKRIKDFILKVNNERYYIRNDIDDNHDTTIMNIIISKYPSSNPNFKIIKTDDIINIRFHNYSLIFTPNIINEFTSVNDTYRIFHDKSSHIPEPNRKMMIIEDGFYNQNNPEVLYKINRYNDLCKFVKDFNSKRFLFIELELYNITIDKITKSYKTVKTTYYIKRSTIDDKNNFLNLFSDINDNYFDIDNDTLICKNRGGMELMKINYFYTDKSSILDNKIVYTYMNTDEYNSYYL